MHSTVHWLVAEWKSNSTFLYNNTPHCFLHLCLCYTQAWFVEFLQRVLALHWTACLLTNTSTNVNTTVMSWCILPNKTCILESGLHSVIIPKRFLKLRLSFVTHTHCVSQSLHIIVQTYDRKFWQFYKLRLSFPYSLHFLISKYSCCNH
jgi:hypothetical protein